MRGSYRTRNRARKRNLTRPRGGLRPSRFRLRWDNYEVIQMISTSLVTTANDLHGFRVKRDLGIVRGIAVRSRSIFGTIGGSLQTLVGGNISMFTELCEKSREEAFELMLQHAADIGANAIVGMRYDANE